MSKTQTLRSKLDEREPNEQKIGEVGEPSQPQKGCDRPVNDKIIRCPAVLEKTGIKSRTGLYQRMNPDSPYYDSTFPMSVKIGKSAVGWSEFLIDCWIKSRSGTR